MLCFLTWPAGHFLSLGRLTCAQPVFSCQSLVQYCTAGPGFANDEEVVPAEGRKNPWRCRMDTELRHEPHPDNRAHRGRFAKSLSSYALNSYDFYILFFTSNLATLFNTSKWGRPWRKGCEDFSCILSLTRSLSRTPKSQGLISSRFTGGGGCQYPGGVV